jgi:transcriptional regulator with XRE-family HTH domain
MNNSNIVTQRFTKCVQRLRENKTIKSSRQLAIELDFLPQTLSEILNGRRDATIEVIRRAVERHRFNPIFLFTGEGNLFLPKNDASSPTESPMSAEISPSDNSSSNDTAHVIMLSEMHDLKNKIDILQQTVVKLVDKA